MVTFKKIGFRRSSARSPPPVKKPPLLEPEQEPPDRDSAMEANGARAAARGEKKRVARKTPTSNTVLKEGGTVANGTLSVMPLPEPPDRDAQVSMEGAPTIKKRAEMTRAS